jgi:hypothetical protein
MTCDRLRGLKLGMPIEDVRRLLGSPPQEWHAGDVVNSSGQTIHVSLGGPDRDTFWTWDSQSSGVRLHLYFFRGHLTEAESYIRTLWRDLFDHESRPTLFELKTDGTLSEGPDFRRIYCP